MDAINLGELLIKLRELKSKIEEIEKIVRYSQIYDVISLQHSESSKHCEHCKGKSQRCLCDVCPQLPDSKCNRVIHCKHCFGTCSDCACQSGCPRSPGIKCYDTGSHCRHMAGNGVRCNHEL
jgi:hypothetical protein